VDTDKFQVKSNKDDFYLTVSRMVPNKRIDLIINAFSKLKDRKLVIIGSGPLKTKLKKIAGSNIEFIDPVPFNVLKDFMESARAFVSASEEDFGITVVEAMAAGTPVIAYGKGGTGESVIHNKTGILFNEANVDSLLDGIKKFEDRIDTFDINSIKEYSNKFNRNNFEMSIKEYIAEKMSEFNF
jgi:glycosyltransferase involved in cell wall biosynthesis